MTATAEQKSFAAPDETRGFERGALDLLQIGGAEIGRLTLQPGWRWSDHVKPLAGTESCRANHLLYCVSGRMGFRMDDGSEGECGPGEVISVEPGHDAWIVGDETCVLVDFGGLKGYAGGS